MKKTKTEKVKKEKKAEVQPAETHHFKNGHKWLAWIMGLTTIWLGVVFVLGLCDDVDLPRYLCYLNTWYVVNIGILTVSAAFSTIAILRKMRSQIFWSATTMYLILLQSISLLIFFFVQQDSAAINAILLFVWSACWYGYMVASPAVEADLPSRHRSHGFIGKVFLCAMTLSTVAYGIMMVINLI